MAIHRVRDAIHDIIEFDPNVPIERALWGIVQTPAFQRLRRIKQLGLSDMVYPGATHTRFNHSIGVFHIARNLITHLKGRGINVPDPNLLLSAALLHDIGHGPFSHVFESVYDRVKMPMDHEELSAEVIKSEVVRDVFEQHQFPYIADQVADFINTIDGQRTIEKQLMSSQLDADRLDYILRDQAMTGTKIGTIDYKWLIDSMEEKEDDQGRILTLRPKAIHAVELYILNLYSLYSTVYFHKTTRGAEVILCEIICRVFDSLERNCWNSCRAGLPQKNILVTFILSMKSLKRRGSLAKLQDGEKKELVGSFMSIDDAAVFGFVQFLKEYSQDLEIKELAERLVDRRLFKAVDVREIVEERLHKTCPKLFPNIADRGGPRQAGASIYWGQLRARVEKELRSISSQIKEDLGTELMHDIATRKAYRTEQPIMVEMGGKLVDLAEISPVVRDLGEYHAHRIYSPEEDVTCVKKRINEWIDGKLVDWEALNKKISEDESKRLREADELANI